MILSATFNAFTLTVKLPAEVAEEVRAIRSGAWTYEQLLGFAKKADEELDNLCEMSPFTSGRPG